MGINAMFFTNPDYLTGEPVEIFEVVKLSQRQFNQFQETPFMAWPFLWKHEPLMHQGEDATSCLLVLGSETADGILVYSKGHAVEKAAYFPAAEPYLHGAVQDVAVQIVVEALDAEGSYVKYGNHGSEFGLCLIPNTKLSEMVKRAIEENQLEPAVQMDNHGYHLTFDELVQDMQQTQE